MRVLICGSRDYVDAAVIEAVVAGLPVLNASGGRIETTIVHGDARGADRLAGGAAERFGLRVESHPADWAQFGKVAGPIRNQEMLDSGLDLVFAFKDNFQWGAVPSTIRGGGGTEDMVRRAKKAGVPTYVVSRA